MLQSQDTRHLRSGLCSWGPVTFWTFEGHRHGHAVLTCSATATAACSAGSCRGRGANTWTPKSRDAEVAGWAALRLKWLRSRGGRLFSLAGAAALAAAARLWVTFTLLPRGSLPWLPALCGLQACDQLSYQRVAACCPPLNSKLNSIHPQTMPAVNGVPHQTSFLHQIWEGAASLQQGLAAITEWAGAYT